MPARPSRGGDEWDHAGNALLIHDLLADGLDGAALVVASWQGEGDGAGEGGQSGLVQVLWGPFDLDRDLDGADVILTSGSLNAFDGFTLDVLDVGDLDGDGSDGGSSLLIGAPYKDDASGQLYIVPPLSSTDTAVDLDEVPSITGETSYFMMGYAIDTADFNGDGIGDIVVGGQGYQCVIVYEGPFESNRDTTTGDWSGWYQNPVGMGHDVTAMGDVDGDGYEDIVASTPYWDEGDDEDDDNGIAFLFLGPHENTHQVDHPDKAPLGRRRSWGRRGTNSATRSTARAT